MASQWMVIAAAILLAFHFLPAGANAAGSFLDGFRDPTDGQLDASEYLISKSGILPVPIIITEPAIGYGGGLALAYFHPRDEQTLDESRQETVKGAPIRSPPSITFVVGAATENGTWIAGGGHFGSWLEDRLRYTGAGAYANVDITFFRENVELEYNIPGFLILQQLEVRLWDSDFFVGANYLYTDVDATRESGPGGILPDSLESAIGGIGLITHYDGRDNVFTPNTGQEIRLEADFYSPSLGSSDEWQMLQYIAHSFHQVHPRVNLSIRFDGNLTWGDTPFYALPYVDLRGIPAMRYQGQYAGEGEIDLRVRVWKRWSLVGFVGLGWIAGEVTSSSDNGPFVAGGGGIRYLLARKLGLQTGIDVARGPEDTTFYYPDRKRVVRLASHGV